MTQGYYWIRLPQTEALGTVWQVGWYHFNRMDRPVWSICGYGSTIAHTRHVEVGPRIEPPTEEA